MGFFAWRTSVHTRSTARNTRRLVQMEQEKQMRSPSGKTQKQLLREAKDAIARSNAAKAAKAEAAAREAEQE